MTGFWQTEGLKHITPQDKHNPEGWDVWAFLRRKIPGNVVEIGCGYGRLCTAFDPDKYHGIDINPAAIDRARAEYPEYTFSMETPEHMETALLYTVALHIPDDEIAGFLDLSAERIVIMEIMGQHWRRPGNPPVYNRDDYEALVSLPLYERMEMPYAHYPGVSITYLDFRCLPSP